MKSLSPSAQAVLDAYGDFEPANVDAMAAALRAAADQMAPNQQDYDEASHVVATVCLNGMTYVANELRAIAAELKAINE